MRFFEIALLCLLTYACSTRHCAEESDPLAAHYIVVESREGEWFCLPYSGLRFLTPFDSLAPAIGKKEREAIACGRVQPGIEDFAKLEQKHEILLYKVSGIDEMEAEALMHKIRDPAGVFRLRDVAFNLRGDVIRSAIKRGYLVRLSEDKSDYYWTKK